MMRGHLNWAASALACALGATSVSAATQLGEHVSLSGFGTLGVAQTDTDAAQFVRDRQNGGVADAAEFNVDSNLGAQMTVEPLPWLSGAVQLLAMHRAEENINVEVEWAFAKLEPINNFAVRAGRMNLPTFAISEFRNVGYAHTWLRPAEEVYGMALLQRLEGADATYRLPIGSSSLSLSVLAGKSFLYGASWQRVDVDQVKGVNLQWEGHGLGLRIGSVEGDVQVDTESDPYTFSGIGASFDRNNVLLQGEYVKRRSARMPEMVNADGWYVFGGYRFNAVTPYLRYGRTKPVDDHVPFHLSGKQATVAAGVRWDAFKSAAIKLQIDRTDTHGTPGISFVTETIALPGGFGPRAVQRPVHVASLALDFVF